MQTPDPISYPKIKIDGVDIEVMFRASDVIRLKKEQNIDLLGESDTVTGALAMERAFILLQAGISHQVQKTVQELTDAFGFGISPIVYKVVGEAKKNAYLEFSETAITIGLIERPKETPELSQVVQ